jgi:dehydrogenase/reductase SDR family member 1
MGSLTGKVALVTGASRGIGKGIALELGAAGAVVYVTGRTTDEARAPVPLEGTIHKTAAEIDQLGGTGIAVRCDHRDDEQVKAVIERIQREQGRLDILVNNAWGGYEGYHNNTYPPPHFTFWERPVSFWDENMDGLRWTYVTTTYAAPLLIASGGRLIVNTSFAIGVGSPAYSIAKIGADRLALEFGHALRPHNITAVSLHLGLVRTEGVMLNAQYFDFTNSESPQFSGRAVVALATDPEVMQKTGLALNVREVAAEYQFDDIDGTRPQPDS